MNDRAPFRCIVADPPWKFGDSLPGKSRGATKNYSVISTKDICSLQLPAIADDALLFLWRVAAMAEDAYAVARAWGFVPKSEIVWVKTTRDTLRPSGPDLHFGMGHYVRAAHEVCLIASRGQGSMLIHDRAVRSVFFARVGAHSEKPPAFFSMLERLCEGPRLELFSRRERAGWTTIGDALGTTLAVKEGA